LRSLAPFVSALIPVASGERTFTILALSERRLAIRTWRLAEGAPGTGIGGLRPVGAPEIASRTVIASKITLRTITIPEFLRAIAAVCGIEFTLRASGARIRAGPLGKALARCRFSSPFSGRRPARLLSAGLRSGSAF
jgi:hypothetical protein